MGGEVGRGVDGGGKCWLHRMADEECVLAPGVPVPTSWEEVLRHPAVEAAEYFPEQLSVRGGWFIRVRAGLCLPDGTHMGIGGTAVDAIKDTFPLHLCNCRRCRELGEGREGGME